MKRGQILVRGLVQNGEHADFDVMDLTEESFRAFVLDRMLLFGMVQAAPSKRIKGDPVEYKHRAFHGEPAIEILEEKPPGAARLPELPAEEAEATS